LNNDLEIISLINSKMSNTVTTKSRVNYKKKSQYNTKIQDNELYTEMMITKKIPVHISNIGNNIKETLETVVAREIEGKCIVEGYIKSGTVEIITFSSGVVRGDNVIFEVVLKCLVCCPVEGMHINCIAKHINKAGIRAELDETPTPVIIFIARDHNYNVTGFSEVQETNKIKVRVIGQRFELNDTYISIIAELLETSKKQNQEPVSNQSSVKETELDVDVEQLPIEPINVLSTINEETEKPVSQKAPSKKRTLKLKKTSILQK